MVNANCLHLCTHTYKYMGPCIIFSNTVKLSARMFKQEINYYSSKSFKSIVVTKITVIIITFLS